MLVEGRVDMAVCDRGHGLFLKKKYAPLFDDIHLCPGEIGPATPLRTPVSLRYFKNHGLSPEEFLDRFNSRLKELRAP